LHVQKFLKLRVILDHLVSRALQVVEERAALSSDIKLGFAVPAGEIIQAVLAGAK
jgi:hypothetical protein